MLTLLRIALSALAVIALAATALPGVASAEGRFALLIANYDYQSGVGQLRNPKRDVDLVASALRRIGFAADAVRTEQNVSTGELRRLVGEHVARVKAAGPGTVSFVYYSGHGVAAPAGSLASRKGSNFLIPTDIASTREPDFWDRTLPLEDIGSQLEGAPEASHIVVFDACRNELVLPERNLSKGFEPMPNSDYVGMLFAFATAPRQAASDGIGATDNGPYAMALADELIKPGIDHLHLFANVRTHVANATRRSQIPWIRDGFLTLTYLAPRTEPPTEVKSGETTHQCVAPIVPPKLAAIEWTPLPNRSSVVFKRPAQTYVDARTDAGFLEQVERGTVHGLAQGSALEIGRIGGRDAWYRYVRNRGSTLPRYISVDDAEAK